MAFSDITQFPRGRVHVAALSNTAKTLFAANVKAKITHIVISGGAAAEVVIFRDLDDSPEIVRVAVAAGQTKVIPGWQVTDQGIEVITVDAAGDVTVTAFTVEPDVTNVA